LDIPNPFKTPRAVSPGEESQKYADFIVMAARLLDMKFSPGEREALAVVTGAVIREAAHVEHSRLVSLLKIISSAAGVRA
jgi:hypothetical protein